MFDAELRALAAAQSGVLSRRQLLGHGVSRRVIARFLADGIVGTLTPGVYLVGQGSGWLGRAWAGILLGGERSVLGLESAGYLHGVIKTEPAEITVFTPADHANRIGWRFIRASRIGNGEPTRAGLEATVLDLCAGRDDDDMAALLADVISNRRSTAKRLLAELAVRRRQPSRRLLRDILGDVQAGPTRRWNGDSWSMSSVPMACRRRSAKPAPGIDIGRTLGIASIACSRSWTASCTTPAALRSATWQGTTIMRWSVC